MCKTLLHKYMYLISKQYLVDVDKI